MELLVLLAFLVLLAVASALGWTADSRDSADWTPSDEGRRQSKLPLPKAAQGAGPGTHCLPAQV